MSRSDVLHGVMNNYKRFYMRKSFLSYPWIRDGFKRRYMLGCLKAFLKSTMERRFYDLGRIGYQKKKEIDFGFDESKVLTRDELVQLGPKRKGDGAAEKPVSPADLKACGGGPSTGPGEVLDAATALPPVADALDGTTDGEPRDENGATIDAFFDPRGYARARAKSRWKEAKAPVG